MAPLTPAGRLLDVFSVNKNVLLCGALTRHVYTSPQTLGFHLDLILIFPFFFFENTSALERSRALFQKLRLKLEEHEQHLSPHPTLKFSFVNSG